MRDLQRAAVVAGVSTYMLGAAAWLRVTARVRPRTSLLRLLAGDATSRALLAAARMSGRGRSYHLGRIAHESGRSFVAPLPLLMRGLPSGAPGASPLVLTEDGRRLGPADALHADIAASGAGRFCHWGGLLYFSSSDGTDPRTNGRRYAVEVMEGSA